MKNVDPYDHYAVCCVPFIFDLYRNNFFTDPGMSMDSRGEIHSGKSIPDKRAMKSIPLEPLEVNEVSKEKTFKVLNLMLDALIES